MNKAEASVASNGELLLQKLAAARIDGHLIPPVSRELLPTTLNDAYALANRLVSKLGLTPIGYKVGANTVPAQRMLGLDEPLTGRIFAERTSISPAIWSDGGNGVGVEAEWILRLGRDLSGVDPEDDYSLLSSIDALFLGLEINRPSYSDPMGAGGLAIIADNGAHAGLVLGNARAPREVAHLPNGPVTLRIDGRIVGSKSARAAGVDPMGILKWLAGRGIDQGQPLRAGDLVATGAIVAVHDLGRAERVEAGLGDEIELVLTLPN